MPKVSVVLSTYNHMKYLPMAVESILAQTFRDFEFIIINDGSTDETSDYIASLTDERIVFVDRDENLGIQKSYNEGFRLVKGEYITFVSSDNYYLPMYLEKLSEALDKNSGVPFVYSAFHWVNQSGQIIRTNYEQIWGIHFFLLNNPGVASVMWRRKFMREVGLLDEEIGIAADTDLWIRMMEHPDWKIKYVPYILCYFLSDVDADSVKRFHLTHESITKMVKKRKERVKYARDNRVAAGRRRTKVLFVVPNCVPYHYAGVEVYTYYLAKELKKRETDVEFIVPKLGPPGITEEEYEGIKIHSLVHDTNLLDMRYSIENPQVEHLFLKFLDANEFDVIHFHHTIGFCFSMIRLAKSAGYPVCLTLHDFWFLCHRMFLHRWDNTPHYEGPETVDECVECLLGGKIPSLEEFASSFYTISYRQGNCRDILNSCVDILTVPSNYSANLFLSRGFGNKLLLSDLGIAPVVTRMKKRDWEGETRFGYFGIIHPIKRVHELVYAFKNLPGDKMRLYIWGLGREDEINFIKELISVDDRILYKGKYTPNQLPEILSQIDVFVNPSLNESFSFTIREAISAGVPVIVREAGAMPEALTKGEIQGLTFRDEETLREAMKSVAMDPSYRIPNSFRVFKPIGEDAANWAESYRSLL